MTEGVKRCSRCGEAKPATLEFFRAKSGRSGSLHYLCRNCARERQLERRRESPEYKAAHERRLARERERAQRTQKACTGCKRVLPMTTEYFDKSHNRLNPRCKACRSEEAKARYLAIKEDKEKYQQRREKERLYAKTNPDVRRRAAAKWQRRNPLLVKQKNAEVRAKRLNAPGNWGAEDLHRQFVAQKGRCLYCGIVVGSGHKRSRWHADHFIPIARGGTNMPNNIVIACATCNLSKGAKLPHEFMPDRFQAPPDQQAAD